MKRIITLTVAFCASFGTYAQINSGNPAKPFNSTTGYTTGIMPANLPSGGAYGKSQDAATAYDVWKARFVSNCPGKGARVLYDDNSSTVSEGIAYGMLLAAYAGDKTLFDNLWLFYKSSTNGNFMHWKWSSCTGISGQGGATDAELDAAMALLVAEDQWPNATSPYDYKAEATSLIGKIRNLEVVGNVFNNGDQWSGSSCRNPSYQSPAYARLFKTIETSQTSFWNGVVSGTNALLRANRNNTTGLVSNWCDNNGNPNDCNNTGNEYGFDACRNPWRMATDVLWNGRATGSDNSTTSLATEISDKIANWAKNDAANLKGPVPQNASSPNVGANKNGGYGTFGLSFMAAGSTYQVPLNTAYTAIVNLGNNDVYYNSTLRCITLFMMTGNFWQPGSNILRATVAITAPANNVTYKENVAVTFSATATVSSGTISKVEYYDGAVLLGTATSSPYTFSTSTLSGGPHVVTAKAYQGSTVVAESGGINVLISGASDISTTGVLNMFETKTPLSELTGGVVGTTCANANTAASAGVFWFQDTAAAPTRKYTFAQKGDGVITYTLSNAANAYNVIGFNFGQYCLNGKLNNYYMNLTQNSVLKFTVSAPSTNTRSMQLKITLKDSAGQVLTFNSSIINATTGKPDTANWYKYDIGFSKNHPTNDYHCILKGRSYNFQFDFSKAFTVKDPTLSGAKNINFNNTDFNFAKVKEVDMIPLDSVDNGAPNYHPVAFSNQVLVFSNVVLGDVSNGEDFCTKPLAPTVSSPASYCQGSAAAPLTASGINGLKLQWYTDPAGGTASTTAPTPSTGSASQNMYYVSQKVGTTGTCEGPRTSILVNVVEGASASAGDDQISVSGPSVSLVGTGSANGTWSVASAPQGTTVAFSPSANSASVTATGLNAIGAYKFNYTVAGTAPCSPVSASVNVNVTTVTSLNDQFLSNSVEIYPNPASENVHVVLDKIDGAKTVKLVDAYGKVVFESSSAESMTIPLHQLSNGMYFVQVQATSGSMTKAIVKK